MSPTTLFRRISCPGQGLFVAISCFPAAGNPGVRFGIGSRTSGDTQGRWGKPPAGSSSRLRDAGPLHTARRAGGRSCDRDDGGRWKRKGEALPAVHRHGQGVHR